MGAAAPLLLLAGTGVQVVGQMRQAAAAENAATWNAFQAKQNADLSIKQSAEDERSFRIATRKQLGGMRASYGASGVSIDASSLDVLEESAATAEMDALRIRHGGQVKAQGFANDSSLYRMQGQASKEQGYISAAGTLIGGAAKSYEKGYF
jgi:hypothetical protein